MNFVAILQILDVVAGVDLVLAENDVVVVVVLVIGWGVCVRVRVTGCCGYVLGIAIVLSG